MAGACAERGKMVKVLIQKTMLALRWAGMQSFMGDASVHLKVALVETVSLKSLW